MASAVINIPYFEGLYKDLPNHFPEHFKKSLSLQDYEALKKALDDEWIMKK